MFLLIGKFCGPNNSPHEARITFVHTLVFFLSRLSTRTVITPVGVCFVAQLCFIQSKSDLVVFSRKMMRLYETFMRLYVKLDYVRPVKSVRGQGLLPETEASELHGLFAAPLGVQGSLPLEHCSTTLVCLPLQVALSECSPDIPAHFLRFSRSSEPLAKRHSCLRRSVQLSRVGDTHVLPRRSLRDRKGGLNSAGWFVF